MANHVVEQKLFNEKRMNKCNDKSVTKEKIEEAKRKSMQIVENLLESSVSEEVLINLCNSLSQGDYLDVIEERNILFLCGYPLCPNKVKPIKQKYHISLETKRVYDITERKCFCSNTCYKASNFLKAQLCSSPIWLKDEEDAPINLLCTTKNRGSAGEEVDLGHKRMTIDDIEQIPEDENNAFSSPFISDDLQACTSKFEYLEISEQATCPLDADSLGSTLLNSEEKNEDSISFGKCDGGGTITEPYVENGNSSKHPLHHVDSNDGDQNELSYDHKVYESLILDNKYMPVIPKTKIRKTLLIDPLGSFDNIVRLSPVSENAVNLLELIRKVLISWFTVETFCIILGESRFESLKTEILGKAKVYSSAELQTDMECKLKFMKDSYNKMCLKLDKEEAIELSSIRSNEKNNSFLHKDSKEQFPENKEGLEQLKVSLFYKAEMGLPETSSPTAQKKSGRNPKSAPRKGSKRNFSKFPTKMKEMEPVTTSTSREVSVLPVIESLSQNTIRRQIVADRLKIVYFDLLPLIGLQYCDISEDIQSLISTFSLTSTNISFKPLEWKIIAVILFRMIEKNQTTKKISTQQMWQLLEGKLISFNISLDQIDSVLSSVTHHSYFEKLLLGL